MLFHFSSFCLAYPHSLLSFGLSVAALSLAEVAKVCCLLCQRLEQSRSLYCLRLLLFLQADGSVTHKPAANVKKPLKFTPF